MNADLLNTPVSNLVVRTPSGATIPLASALPTVVLHLKPGESVSQALERSLWPAEIVALGVEGG